MASIILPFVTTFDDSGTKKAEKSLLGLSKTSVISAISVTAVADQLGKAVRAAAEDRKEQDLLRNAIENNTTATSAQAAEVEKTIGKMQFQAAVSDSELRPAMANLVRATGDVTKAQGLLSLALDISAGTGRSLESVSIALSKAQQGNLTALTRLGIPLDQTAVKSKDLAKIQEDLQGRFQGASDAAANSAEGGIKKLRIALDETYEKVGNQLLPVLDDYALVLSDLAQKALNAETSSKGHNNRLVDLVKLVNPAGQLIKGLQTINGLIKNQADDMRDLTRATSRVTNAAKERMGFEELQKKADERQAIADDKAAKAKEKAAAAAKKYADTLRDRVKTAVDATTEAVDKAQSQFDNFSSSISGTFSGFASLSDAFKSQTDAIDEERDALRKRADAYKALDLAKQGDDVDALAKATQDLADAEANVATASKKRSETNTISEFQKQIASAKKFGENIKYLIGHGLTQQGLAQILNLGPVAGVEVTNDMIGRSFWDFQASMAELSGIASDVGLKTANAFFGGALATATSNQQAVNQYQITVNAGLVSNPAQVGRDIIEAIKSAERVSGVVFVPA